MGTFRGIGKSFWEGCGLGIILLVALALRLQGIRSESAYWDEVVSLQHLNAPGVIAFIRQVRADDPPMTPLYFVVQYAWAGVFGPDLVTVRMLSVLFGLTSLVLVHLLGRRMFGEPAGLLAAALMALSVPHIYYSQELRPYALVLVLTALSAYSLLEGLAKRRAVWWWVNVAADICLMWTHLFAVLFLVAQGIFLGAVLWRRGRIRCFVLWAAAQAPAAIAWTLWFRSMDFVALDEASYLRRFLVCSPRLMVGLFMHLCGDRAQSLKPFLSASGLSAADMMALFIGVLIVGAAGSVLWNRPAEDRAAARTNLLFLVAWMTVPALLLYIYSVAWYPSFGFRYVYHSAVPVAVLAGAAVSMVRIRWLQAVIAVTLLSIYSVNLGHYPHPWRMNWKSVARDLQQNAGADDPVLVYWKSQQAPLLYASGFQPDRVGIIRDQHGLVAKCAELAAQGRTVWLVVRPDALDAVGWPRYEELFKRCSLTYETKTFGSYQPVLQRFRVSSPPPAPARSLGELRAAQTP